MAEHNRRFLLRERPQGRIGPNTFELVEEDVPEAGEGIGKPKEGETVVVSAAAGAVGSMAAQIAKIKGARVVGIAGGPAKCALLTEQLGLDATVDHRADDWHDDLVAATPDGIDVDFENVGGPIMDAIFARLNLRARVVLCGLISDYNSSEP